MLGDYVARDAMAGSQDTEDDLATGLMQLRKSEFGYATEVAVRYVLVISGASALYLYSGVWYGLVWAAAYLFSQFLTYVALYRAKPPYRHLDYAFGIGGLLLTSTIFVTLPVGVFMFCDPVLAYGGGMALVALCVFSLWREDPPVVLLPYDLGLAWVTAALIGWAAYPVGQGILAQGIVIVLTITAVSYYSFALVANTRTRQQLRSAAKRGIEAQKMEAIGRLSGGIAHDFNNILTVLQGNLELYQEINDPEERSRLIQEAHQASRRAAGLVAQLLAYARRAPLTPRDVSVAATIDELAALSARLLPANISVFPAIPLTDVSVRADHDQLISALLNLIQNARDAMPDRGEITISARAIIVGVATRSLGLRSGRYVRFSIADTGTGMPPEVAARAVEPFFSTKPVGEGSGLGLSTAKGFAEQSGGTLTIKSDEKGTEVALYSPQSDDAVQTDTAQAKSPTHDSRRDHRPS